MSDNEVMSYEDKIACQMKGCKGVMFLLGNKSKANPEYYCAQCDTSITVKDGKVHVGGKDPGK
jgi:hypothetical protein